MAVIHADVIDNNDIMSVYKVCDVVRRSLLMKNIITNALCVLEFACKKY